MAKYVRVFGLSQLVLSRVEAFNQKGVQCPVADFLKKFMEKCTLSFKILWTQETFLHNTGLFNFLLKA